MVLSFPKTVGAGTYAIVKLDILEEYSYWGEYRALVIRTISKVNEKVDKDHCFAEIGLRKLNDFPLFDQNIKEYAEIFTYSGGTLRINDYVELVEKDTVESKKFYVSVKKQLTTDADQKPLYIENQYIKIYEDFRGAENRMADCSPTELAPLLKTQYLFQKAYEQLEELHTIKYNLPYVKSEKEEQILNMAKEVIESKIAEVEKRVDQYRSDISHINRMIHSQL